MNLNKKHNLQQIGREKRKLAIMQRKANLFHYKAKCKNKVQLTVENDQLHHQLMESNQTANVLRSHLNQAHADFNHVSMQQKLFKKLWIVKLLKPLIQLEKGIRSANHYRRDFRKLIKEKGSIGKAYQTVRHIYKKEGFRAAKQYLRHFSNNPSYDEKLHNEKPFNFDDGVVILTTKHTHFVAKLLSECLDKLDIANEIIFEKPNQGYSKQWHIVICAQIFDTLPENYLVFQMEQSISSRWFTEEYFMRLKNARFVFDYATTNLQFLQENGIEFSKLFYLPIDFLQKKQSENVRSYEYDVVFYGDPSSPRRQNFLKKLQEKFEVKVVSEVFGNELYGILQKAKIIVNIHHYENALLETTRIYECLSLNKLIISEVGSDQVEHHHLNHLVDFVEIDDVDNMVNRISYWLNHEKELKKRLIDIRLAQEKAKQFQFFFYRFLLSQDLLDFDQFYELCGDYVQPKGDFWCLSLHESVLRRRDFEQDNYYGIEIVSGLRHKIGWIGCGLSYKFMMKRAADLKLPQVTICEDDVLFYENFAQRYQNIHIALSTTSVQWNIFSGLIADLSEKVEISHSNIQVNNEKLYSLTQLVSTVFNVYHHSAYNKISEWDYHKRTTDNTIDRYIETHGGIKGLVASPFLVGHKEDLSSTLWGTSNTVYAPMIAKSQNVLNEKIADLK